MRQNTLFSIVAFFPLLVIFSQSSLAQYNETIRTARPGAAVGPFTTGKYVFQLQSGFTYGQYQTKQTNDLKGNNTVFGAVFRYGLFEKFELRAGVNVRQDRIESSNAELNKFGGLSILSAGLRYNILDGTGSYKPSLGIQGDVNLTWVDVDYREQNAVPRLMLIYGQKLSETFTLTTNLAAIFRGKDAWTLGTYVVNLSFPIYKKWSGFIEAYGAFTDKRFTIFYDTGVGFLINNDLQLDLSGGIADNFGIVDWFVDGGVSWRVKFK